MPENKTKQDFRAVRSLLPDEAFLLVDGERPAPTDLVAEDIWSGIIHLPDDVSLTTSSHHGAQLKALYRLWGDWIDAIGDVEDNLYGCMLDATDCFQASTFDSLRSAVSNLRSALELAAIGATGNLSPQDPDFLRWTKQQIGSLPFSTALRKLRGATKARQQAAFNRTGCQIDHIAAAVLHFEQMPGV